MKVAAIVVEGEIIRLGDKNIKMNDLIKIKTSNGITLYLKGDAKNEGTHKTTISR